MRLAETSLLTDLEHPDFAAIRSAFSSRTVEKGALAFTPNDEPSQIFIVKSGRCRVYLASQDKEFTMGILDPGSIYASHTRAFVVAMEKSELLVAHVQDVRTHLLTMPSLTSSMIRVLGDLLSHAFTVIDRLAFMDVRKRLLELLAFEAKRMPMCKECTECGGCTEGGMVSLGLTTEQLASIIGSSRQTVSSMLNAMAKDGIVQMKGRGVICIPDISRLEELLQID